MKKLKFILCCLAVFTLTVSAFSANASADWYDDISGGTYNAIVGEPYVAETFHGVNALYSLAPGSYQCAELIPRFYKEAYGLDTFVFASYGSAFGLAPIEMQTPGYKFVTPETPSPGDIIYTTSSMRSGRGDHWAIVKSFDGNTITLFEQNVKYNGKAGTNRKLKYPSDYYYIYSPRKISDNSKPSLGGTPSITAPTTVAQTTAVVATTAATTVPTTAATTAVITTTQKPTQAPTTIAATTAVYTTAPKAVTTKTATTKIASTTALHTKENATLDSEMMSQEVIEDSTTAIDEYSATIAMSTATKAVESSATALTKAIKTSANINYKPMIAAGAALAGLVVFLAVFIITKKSRG